MQDTNLRWLKEVIRQRNANNGKTKASRKGLNYTQKKLLKYISSFRIMKDLIYLVDEDKFGNERYRYVMPKNETNLTMQEVHCKETAGHLDTDKTIEKIKSRFFWTNLSKDVKKFVKECFECQKVKPPKTYCKPKLMPLGPTRTQMIVTMEMAGPIPEKPMGHKYILAMCDHFTKHVKVFSMKGPTAKEVAEKCMEYCMTFGIPEAILTDRGTNFRSQVIESLWELLDVLTLCTTAYHPQADGITERFNRTIKIKLTQFDKQDEQNDWDLKLEELSFAYNTAVNAKTKCSPFELIFGRIPKLPIDLVYDQTNAEDMRAKYEVEWIASEFVDKQRKEIRAMFDFAAANRDAAALKASALYDRTIRGIDFKIGDKVWLLDQSTKVNLRSALGNHPLSRSAIEIIQSTRRIRSMNLKRE